MTPEQNNQSVILVVDDHINHMVAREVDRKKLEQVRKCVRSSDWNELKEVVNG